MRRGVLIAMVVIPRATSGPAYSRCSPGLTSHPPLHRYHITLFLGVGGGGVWGVGGGGHCPDSCSCPVPSHSSARQLCEAVMC